MGLLDNPQDAAMLQMGLGLLSAGGPSRMPVSLGQAIGSAGNQAMDAYRQAQMMQERQAQRKLQEQMGGVQLQQHQMQLQEAQRRQAALQQFRDQLPEPMRPAFDVDPAGFMAMLKPKEPQYKEINGTLVKIGSDGVSPVYTAPPDPNKMSRKDELELQAKLRMDDREFAARIAAATRPPEAPNLVQVDVNGQPQLVPARQAVGMKPWMDPKGSGAPSGFRFTPSGNLEAIPGGPADAKTQAQSQLKATGAADVDAAVSTLRNAYDRLETGGGITSTKGNALSNAAAAASSSTLGQMVGRTFGTQNQSARNDIAMTRPALLAALMKATGMSAKQMDSNAELKLWLATATDPTLDVESNRRALDAIERKYLQGGAMQPSGVGDLQSAAAAELARRQGRR